MHYAKRRMIICGVVSFLFAGSALAQSHKGFGGDLSTLECGTTRG